jgi:hypothetical protein
LLFPFTFLFLIITLLSQILYTRWRSKSSLKKCRRKSTLKILQIIW